MRVVQEERMGMAWSRMKEQYEYEDDCFKAVMQTFKKIANNKSSYLFSGREMMFLEDPASRDQSETLDSIWGGDSRSDVTGNSLVARQQQVPRSTVHEEHELGKVKEPRNGKTLTGPDERSQGVKSLAHQTASVKRKVSLSPPPMHDTQGRNARKTSIQNSSLAKQDQAKGIRPVQSQSNTYREKKEQVPSHAFNFMKGANQVQEQTRGKPLSSVQASFHANHGHAVKAKGMDSSFEWQAPRTVSGGSASKGHISSPRYLNSSTESQKPMIQNHFNSSAKPDFRRTDTGNYQQKAEDVTANKRPKREHRLSASMSSMHDRSKENVNSNPLKNTKSPAKTTNTDPQVVIIKLEGVDSFDITTDQVKHLSVARRYPSLVKVIPTIGGPHISLQWSLTAVHLVIKYVFNPQWNFEPLPNGKTIIEALAAALEFGVTDFRSKMTLILLQKLLTQQNAVEFYHIADYFGDKQLCTAIEDQFKHLSSEEAFPRKGTVPRFRNRSCVVSCQFFVQPLEVTIPSGPGSNTLLEENKRDMQCHIQFESVLGSFAICGIQMSFAVDKDYDNTNKLKIDYQLENLDQGQTISGNKEKPLRPKVILYFKKELEVRKGEKCKLTVESELSPKICHILKQKIFKGKFQMSLSSNYKAKNDEHDRFFIVSVFYKELP